MTSEIVRVSSKGQATIPTRFRRRHGIPAPGLVRFTEVRGKLIVEAIPDPAQMEGILREALRGSSAQDLLRRERTEDRKQEARKAR